MSSDVEKIIEKTLKQIFLNYDQERLTVINALMSNVDILLNNSEAWFGEDSPDEYKRVTKSLLKLSNFLVGNRNNYEVMTSVSEKSSIILKPVIEIIIRELMDILDYSEISVKTLLSDDETKIITSGTILKESIYNIFFSLYPFMKDDSKCDISISKDNFNITVDFDFKNLNEFFPGSAELKKRLFTYVHNGEEKIGIGIDSAVNSLRNTGAVIKIQALNRTAVFSLTVQFPSIEFYDHISEIRNSEKVMLDKKNDGTILAVIEDPMMHLLLDDFVEENGLVLQVINLIELNGVKDFSAFNAVIFDYSLEIFNYPDIIENLSKSKMKLILIHGKNDSRAEGEFFSSFNKLMKPFNIDDIVKLL